LRQFFLKTPDIGHLDIFNYIDLSTAELTNVREALTRNENKIAEIHLSNYFKNRTHPIFFFKADNLDEIIQLIDHEQKRETILNADQICKNIFNFRRAGDVRFSSGINWNYSPKGNIDWTWDLNRHTYFETLGRAYLYTKEERYFNKFSDLLLDWLANNPTGVHKPNWSSVFEIAFRINTWLWAFFYFRGAQSFGESICLPLLKGLLIHGLHLSDNLEYHVQNNHLLIEAKALVMLGLLFAEFKDAKKWRQHGLKIFFKQIIKQVCNDGVHGERAMHYHRIITGEVLELLVLFENNNIEAPLDVIKIFNKMVEFELWTTKPNGRIPLLGDSALEDTHLRFSAIRGGPPFLKRKDLKSISPLPDESEIWLLGKKRIQEYYNFTSEPTMLNSRSFPDGGYFVMRGGQDPQSLYLVFDCGPFGYYLTPNHGHADALSFEMHACGQTMLVDPGYYSAHLGQDWRNFFRGTRAHNTIVVDNQDQSFLLDTRRVYHPAQVELHEWISNEHFDFVDGSHNGYRHLPQPIKHRRQIFFVKPEYWIVIDVLTGSGKHICDLYYHMMPHIETHLNKETGYLRCGVQNETILDIVPLNSSDLQADIISGKTNPLQGWVSFYSGEKQPAPVLRYRKEGTAPVDFCTVIYPYDFKKKSAVTANAVNVKIDDLQARNGSRLSAVRVETDTYTDYLVVDRGNGETLKFFDQFRINGQLVYLRLDKTGNEVLKVIQIGGDFIYFKNKPITGVQGFTDTKE